MAEIVRMPKLSDTMTEGVVAKWHKKIGDKIKSGDLLAEIETDKATMDFESFQEGVLLYIGVQQGKAAPVDAILAILGNEGEDVSSLINAETTKQSPPKTETAKVENPIVADTLKPQPKVKTTQPQAIASSSSHSTDASTIVPNPTFCWMPTLPFITVSWGWLPVMPPFVMGDTAALLA